MYDTLTDHELSQLARKLSSAGTAFYDSAIAIGRTAELLRESGRIEPLSPEWNGLWAARRPIVAAMDEMHALMAEADDEARARRCGPGSPASPPSKPT